MQADGEVHSNEDGGCMMHETIDDNLRPAFEESLYIAAAHFVAQSCQGELTSVQDIYETWTFRCLLSCESA